MLRLAALSVVLAACHPTYYTAAPQTAAYEGQAEAPPAEDTRNAGQVIADILATQGYTCTAQETNWECIGPSPNWQLYLSYVPSDDGSTTIWFDSYLERAFAKRCAAFGYAMQDLHDEGSSFTASCEDSTRLFRFNTAVMYGADLDVMAWVHAHEASRQRAASDLRGIKALSRDSARAVANL